MSDGERLSAGRWARWGDVAFAWLLAVSVLPVWWSQYFPSQDGPAHVQNAYILKHYRDPDWPLVREFYAINARPDPNWFGHLVLAGLMTFAAPEVAEKILVTGYLVLLPLGSWYALRGLKPGAGPLAVLVIPLAHNVLLHRGFYNFCYGLAVYFFVVGYWVRHRERFTLRSAGVLFLLGAVLYLCHPVALAMAIATIGFWAVWLTGADWLGERAAGRALVSRALVPAAVLAVPVVLAALFVRRQGTGIVPAEPARVLWRGLRSLEVLFSFQPAEWGVATLLAWLFGVTAAGLLVARLRGRRLGVADGWLVLAGLFAGLYFAAPEGVTTGTFLNQRLSLFPYFALVLWLGAAGLGGRVAGVVLGAGAVLTSVLLVLHLGSYVRIGEQIGEYLRLGENIRTGSTVLPLCYAPQGVAEDGRGVLAMRCQPLLHTSGYWVGSRRTVDLRNYEANTGYFPLVYREGVNPYRLIGREEGLDKGLSRVPPRAEFLGYGQETGRPVDYVPVFRLPGRGWPEDGPTQEVRRQLEAGYRFVQGRGPAGEAAWLFERKGMEGAGGS